LEGGEEEDGEFCGGVWDRHVGCLVCCVVFLSGIGVLIVCVCLGSGYGGNMLGVGMTLQTRF
jgi:hypothetical protein